MEEKLNRIGTGPDGQSVWEAVDGGFYGVIEAINYSDQSLFTPDLLRVFQQMRDRKIEKMVLSFDDYMAGLVPLTKAVCEVSERKA